MALAGDDASPGGALVLGVARWKRAFVRPFVAGAGPPVAWRPVSRDAVAEARRERRRLCVWAAREPPWLDAAAAAAGVRLTRIEDGFLRSAGLGSNFIAPLSLVLDEAGIHFDPARESGLERLLNDPAFPPPELRAAARHLRARLVAGAVTKYNLRGAREKPSPALRAAGRRVILVPGQVEDDASIRHGSPVLRRNLDLLAAVRRAAPDAIILYKPHPEIEAGNRRGAVPARDARRFADHILMGSDAPSALALADEVHTMTSLIGFEALLRGLAVTCHGLPFYAGLGLTRDLYPWPRPRRQVDLDTLVAAALIAYPAYRDPETGRPMTVFAALDMLERGRVAGPPAGEPLARAARWLRLMACG